jgi:hypothetical protein
MWSKILIYMILFYIVANPTTFKLMRKGLGSWVASPEGLPHSAGLLLHSAVYVLLACYLPAKLVSGYEEETYVGEYGQTTKYPFSPSNTSLQEAGNPGSDY